MKPMSRGAKRRARIRIETELARDNLVLVPPDPNTPAEPLAEWRAMATWMRPRYAPGAHRAPSPTALECSTPMGPLWASWSTPTNLRPHAILVGGRGAQMTDAADYDRADVSRAPEHNLAKTVCAAGQVRPCDHPMFFDCGHTSVAGLSALSKILSHRRERPPPALIRGELRGPKRKGSSVTARPSRTGTARGDV